jgi:hypothetical protein
MKMQRNLTSLIGVFVFVLLLLTPAMADYFVNTGTPTGTGGPWELSGNPSIIAGQFTATFTGLVTNIAGFMYFDPSQSTNNHAWAQIYDNSAGNAYPGAFLGEGSFQVGVTHGWYGIPANGIFLDTINLTAGDKYWVAIGAATPPPPNPSFFGYMPGDAPNPLTNVAVYSGLPWPYVWTAADWSTENLPVGFLVEGTPVPLPGSLWLLGCGLLGLGGWRRFRKN